MTTDLIISEISPEGKSDHALPGCTCEYGQCWDQRAVALREQHRLAQEAESYRDDPLDPPVSLVLTPTEQQEALRKAIMQYYRLIARHVAEIGQPPDAWFHDTQDAWDAMERRIIAGYSFILHILEPALTDESEGR